MRNFRTKMCLALFIALTCFLWSGSSQAQVYPKGPVQLILPFGAGGVTDLLWRTVSESIGANLKGTIAMVNKPGAGGVIGTSFVVAAKPDGYTLVSANSDPLTMLPVFTPNVTYDPERDFTYIAKLAAFASAISVRADSQFKTLEELIIFAKANPRKLKCAVNGIGSVTHTILQVLNSEAKIEVNSVVFESGGELITNLLGGHTDLIVSSVAAVNSQVQAGKIRILGIGADKRIPGFENFPTLSEKGLKKSSISTGVGLAGPKGLPPEIVNQWEVAIDKSLKDPKMVATLEKLGGTVVDYRNGEGFKKDLLDGYSMFKQMFPKASEKK